MKAIDAIRIALSLGDDDLHFIEDMREAPLTRPTSYTGNHPLWILGHLTVAEGRLHQIILGEPNPVEHWKPIFDWGTEPSDDVTIYPPLDEVMRTYRQLRAKTLAFLEEMGDDGLDRPPKASPPGFAAAFSTVGKTLLTIASHQSFHGGQASVARRAGGRKPFFVPSEELRKW